MKKEIDLFYHYYHNSVLTFKHLNWSAEKVYDRYSSLFEIKCDFIQNYSFFVFQHNYLFLQLGLIDEKLNLLAQNTFPLGIQIFNYVLYFVHDLLIATCFVPTKAIIYPVRPNTVLVHENETNWFSLPFISVYTLHIALTEMISLLTNTFDNRFKGTEDKSELDTSYFKFMVSSVDYYYENYDFQSFMKSMVNITLLNYTPDLRQSIASDSLFKLMAESKYVAFWMMASRSFDEQYYLNTCEIATIIYAISSHHTNIASFLIFLKGVTDFIIKRANNGQMDSEFAYVPIFGHPKPLKEYTLEKTNLLLSRIQEVESKVLSLYHELEDKSELNQADFLKMNHLFLNINYAIQEASCVFNNLKPVVLTPKLFSNRWHISAITMFPIHTLTQYIPNFPPSPVRCLASGHFGKVPCYRLHQFVNKIERHWDMRYFEFFSKKLQFAMADHNLNQVSKMINTLWKKLLTIGGALFASAEVVWDGWTVGHLSFIQAILLPRTLVRPFSSHFSQESPFIIEADGNLQTYFTIKGIEDRTDNECIKIDFDSNEFLPKGPQDSKQTNTPTNDPLSCVDRYFLVSDPETKNSKICTFQQVTNYILDEDVSFDFENTLGPFYDY